MPVAQYWRAVGISTAAGGDLALSALYLYGQGGRLDASAVLQCSHAPLSGTLANLQDASLDTGAVFAAAAIRSGGFRMVWDLGSSGADVTALVPGALDQQAQFMDGYTLQYFAGGAWVSLPQVKGMLWPGVRTLVALRNSDPFNAQTMFVLGASAGVPVDQSGNTELTTLGAVTASSVIEDGFLFSGASGIRSSSSLLMGIGAGEFCVEGFAAIPTFSGWQTLFDCRLNGAGFAVYVSAAGLLCYADNDDVRLYSTSSVGLNAPFHWVAQRRAGTVDLWIAGLPSGSYADARTMASAGRIDLGVNYVGSQGLAGVLSSVRVTKAARYTGNFVPPMPPLKVGSIAVATSGDGYRPCTAAVAAVAASALVPVFATRHDAVAVARDTEFGGLGRYPFKVEGLTGSQKARVTLLRARDKLVAREAWSAADGSGEFTGLDVASKFIAVAQDPSGLMHPCGAEHYPELPKETP